MFIRSKFWAGSLIVMALASVASPARAQSIDYSGLADIYEEPVTTSANGSPLRKSESPVNMEIVTASDIQKSGARSIPEALRFLPGINVQQKTFGQTELSIRGYNQNNAERVLVLLNGRQVYTDFFGQVNWDNIPVEMGEIEQIEVVKGPNTALFGFNAVSGVVNIITKNPLHTTENAVSASYGTQDYSNLSAHFLNRVSDHVAIRFSGGVGQATNTFDDIPSAIFDDYGRTSMALDTWLQFSESVQGQIEITSNNNDRGEFVFPANTPAFTKTKSQSIRGRIMADTKLGMIEADLYHNAADERLNLFVLSSGNTGSIKADNDITVAKLSDTFSINGAHTFRIGGEYRTASNIFEPIDREDLVYDNYSANGLWDWRINEKLRSSLAVRYDLFKLEPDSNDITSTVLPAGINPFTADDYKQKREEVSWNYGLVYQPTDLDTLRASIARGVGLPSFTEFGLQFFSRPTTLNPNGLATFGNPNIKTTLVDNYELSYDRKIEDLNGLFRGSIFYQQNKDIQGFGADITNTPNVFGAGIGLTQSLTGNLGDSDMYGVELGLTGKFASYWNWNFNYAFVNVEDDLNNKQLGNSFSSNSEYEDANRDHIINIGLGYERDRWSASINGQYTTSWKGLRPIANQNTAYNQIKVNPEFVTNANLSYKLNDHLTWSVSGTNIINDSRQYQDSTTDSIVWTTLKYKF